MKAVAFLILFLGMISCSHKHERQHEACKSGKQCSHSQKCEHKDAESCPHHDANNSAHKSMAAGEGHAKHQHDFTDATQWAKKFNNPERAKWQKPEEVISLMQLQAGDTVADIGAGTGYMIPYLSKAVGDNGRVYGLDVEVSLIEFMNGYISEKELVNSEARLISKSDPGLLSIKPNRVLFVNTWHHISERKVYAKRLSAQLEKGSQVFVVEFDHKKEDFGPPIEMRLKPKQVKSDLESSGFECKQLSESLPRQYVIKCALN